MTPPSDPHESTSSIADAEAQPAGCYGLVPGKTKEEVQKELERLSMLTMVCGRLKRAAGGGTGCTCHIAAVLVQQPRCCLPSRAAATASASSILQRASLPFTRSVFSYPHRALRRCSQNDFVLVTIRIKNLNVLEDDKEKVYLFKPIEPKGTKRRASVAGRRGSVARAIEPVSKPELQMGVIETIVAFILIKNLEIQAGYHQFGRLGY